MRHIYITLGRRIEKEGLDTEDTGDVVIVDYDSWKVVGCFPIVGRNNVLHGRSRGASGIDWLDNFIYVASRTDLICINPDTFQEDHRINIGFPWAIHQVRSHGNQLHMACVDRNMKQVVEGRHVIDIVPTICSGTGSNDKPLGSFNAIAFHPDGDEYHMYTSLGYVYNFTKQTVAADIGLKIAAHDICFMNGNEFLFTKSVLGELVKFNMNTDTMETVYKVDTCYLDSHNVNGFMRGILYSKAVNAVFVTTGPGTLHELDIESFALRRQLNLLSNSDTSRICPFSMLLDPRDFGERGKGSY